MEFWGSLPPEAAGELLVLPEEDFVAELDAHMKYQLKVGWWGWAEGGVRAKVKIKVVWAAGSLHCVAAVGQCLPAGSALPVHGWRGRAWLS
jgi:hypothetical protein